MENKKTMMTFGDFYLRYLIIQEVLELCIIETSHVLKLRLILLT